MRYTSVLKFDQYMEKFVTKNDECEQLNITTNTSSYLKFNLVTQVIVYTVIHRFEKITSEKLRF